jgi:two-component system cell cycle response regulator
MSDQSAEKPHILVVDDSRVIRLAARKMLSENYEIHLAEDGQEAWEFLQQNDQVSVVFTDLSMPNMGGMELLENIRSSDSDHIVNLPVIIMTGADDTESTKQTVFDKGATDFIAKPFESIDLVSRAKAYAKLSRKVVELEKKTGFDKLTGLYNANSLQEQGSKSFSFASRHKLYISTVYFEIENFQEFFLNYGKNVAQHILVAVGKRLKEVMREEDIAARIGVARYALVLPMTNRQNTEIVISRVRESINKLVFDTGKEKLRVNFLAGYSSPALSDDVQFGEMLEQTENALLRAIESESESVVCFGDEQPVEQVAEITEADIQQALSLIVEGNFYQIPEQHRDAVMDRLVPFMQFMRNQQAGDTGNEPGFAIQ